MFSFYLFCTFELCCNVLEASAGQKKPSTRTDKKEEDIARCALCMSHTGACSNMYGFTCQFIFVLFGLVATITWQESQPTDAVTDELFGDQGGIKLTKTETEDTGKNCIPDKDSPEEKIQKSPEEKPGALPLNEPPPNQLKTPDHGQKIDKEKDGEKSNNVKEKEAAKEADNMMPDSPGSLGTTLVLSPNPRKRSCTAPSATSQNGRDTTMSKKEGTKDFQSKGCPKVKVFLGSGQEPPETFEVSSGKASQENRKQD